MTIQENLPETVVAAIRAGYLTEFSTVSAAGVPIDTPVAYFPSDGLKSIDLATGLSYPAKAERARKNPKVGLLIEGRASEPVISIAGMAAVRDSDLQANALRYIAEVGYSLPGNPDWALAHKAVWYWTRILIEVTPARVLWWDNAGAMDRPPHRWEAPAGTVYPKSDPAAPGAVSSAAHWKATPWQELADRAIARGYGGHLSVLDEEGYPRPIRARTIARTGDSFSLELPTGLPWPLTGKASLTFQGIETFVGDLSTSGGSTTLRVERALPVFPMVADLPQLWEPTPDTYEQLMARLRHETQRRGLPIPTIPLERPEPTEGYKLRLAARAKASQ
jgi:hypothetical protein